MQTRHFLWITAAFLLVPQVAAEHYEPQQACPPGLVLQDGGDGGDGYDGADGYDGVDGYDGQVDGVDGSDGGCEEEDIPVFPSVVAGILAVAIGALAYVFVLRR